MCVTKRPKIQRNLTVANWVIRTDRPRRRIEMPLGMVGGPSAIVISFKFLAVADPEGGPGGHGPPKPMTIFFHVPSIALTSLVV